MKNINKIKNDLTGKKMWNLTVIELAQTGTRKTYWMCRCDCGKVFRARADQLLSGATKSCGCLHLKNFDGNRYNRTHNESTSTLYHRWQSMRKRCYKADCKSYPRYGGRGITVCDEWNESYESFRDWAINNGYNPSLTIDRIDNNGNYDPNNCRWTDLKTQCRNRRSNIIVTVGGVEMTLIDACEKTGIAYKTAYYRYKAGWPTGKVFC
jgi:hypothetical protein